jgi:cephalosporin hydroxylase
MELTLEQLAVKYNTDKAKFCHNYCEVYDTLFRHIRNDVKLLLELGISEGASIKMWRDYMPNAWIHGTDIVDYPDILLRDFGSNITCHNCDQTDRVKMKQMAESVGGQFDIIIDDASHAMNDILISLDVLFPYLKEGGLYIIEDIENPRTFDEHLTQYTHWFAVADSPILNSNLVIIKK